MRTIQRVIKKGSCYSSSPSGVISQLTRIEREYAYLFLRYIILSLVTRIPKSSGMEKTRMIHLQFSSSS